MRISNLANVKTIAIGFGDGAPAAPNNGNNNNVYFDEILLGQGNAEEPFNDGAVELDEDPFVNTYHGYPLYLKQGCPLIEAGAGYIDEEPYLIGKSSCVYQVPDTNELHGIPDTNMVNIGCHYFDWNYAYGTLKSDLYRDKVVNFVDFAFLAAGWLTIYDMDDLVTMADEWMGVAEPNIQIIISGDANNGYVEVGVGGYSSDTQRIFLLADGQYVGEIYGFENGDTLGIDISELGGGERQLKAIGVDIAGQVTCSNVTNTEFICPLNYCFLPSSYEPNKPLCFSAFNPSAEDVSVKVYADDGNLVWSQTYSGDSVLGSIPAGITNQYEFDYINFDVSGGEMLKAGGGAAMASDGGGSVTKITDMVKHPSSDIKALIIAPKGWDRAFGFDSIRRVQKAFKARGINYVKLSGRNATYDKISEYAKNVKYMYVNAHGKYRSGKNGVLRTNVKLYDGTAVSMKRSELPPDEVPSWCEDLGGGWEFVVNTFYSMGFMNLEFAYFDCCYSGRLVINEYDQLVEGQRMQIGLPFAEELRSDMSEALGMHESIFENKAYQGWYEKSHERLIPIPVWPFSTYYELWTRDMWERLGAGDTVGEALMITMDRTWWSSDPNAPINAFRFKGQGDIVNIKLE